MVGGLQVGCSQPTSAEVKVPLGEAAFEAESVAPRKQYIEAFADKNENGKFDGTDTKLYWVGTTLSCCWSSGCRCAPAAGSRSGRKRGGGYPRKRGRRVGSLATCTTT